MQMKTYYPERYLLILKRNILLIFEFLKNQCQLVNNKLDYLNLFFSNEILMIFPSLFESLILY